MGRKCKIVVVVDFNLKNLHPGKGLQRDFTTHTGCSRTFFGVKSCLAPLIECSIKLSNLGYALKEHIQATNK